MRIATWNLNSVTTRLPRLLEWLEDSAPDVLCVQETKVAEDKFPTDVVAGVGYEVAHHGQGRWNGVAILSRAPIADVTPGMPQFPDDHKRVIAATVGDIRFVCFYVPNGQSVDSDKYQYKLRWLAADTAYLRDEIACHPRLAVVGDINIAPEDRDVHDPDLWRGQVLCTDAERAAFRDWLGLGLKDAFRLFDQPEKTFSWWDYRQLAFPKNHGLRIDHILLSAPLAARCAASRIDRNERKGVCRIPPHSRQEPRFAEPVSDHR